MKGSINELIKLQALAALARQVVGPMLFCVAEWTVDTDVIRLLSRWQSDEMLHYLHSLAEPLMRNFASQMLLGGAFTLTLIPNQDCPSFTHSKEAYPPTLNGLLEDNSTSRTSISLELDARRGGKGNGS